MLRYPNRVSQSATYHAGSPDYVDVSTGLADDGMRTFPAAASGWADADTVPVLLYVSPTQYAVWTAIWDAANGYLLRGTEDLAVGAITDGDTVSVAAVPSEALIDAVARGAEFVFEGGSARTLGLHDFGQTLRCTSASPTTITLPGTLPAGFHCLVVREGAGDVVLSPDAGASVNGDTVPLAGGGQYSGLYLYQPDADGAWVALGTTGPAL